MQVPVTVVFWKPPVGLFRVNGVVPPKSFAVEPHEPVAASHATETVIVMEYGLLRTRFSPVIERLCPPDARVTTPEVGCVKPMIVYFAGVATGAGVGTVRVTEPIE